LPFKETLHGDFTVYNGLIYVVRNGENKEYIHSFYKGNLLGNFHFLRLGEIRGEWN
jgi:hypothetical protein